MRKRKRKRQWKQKRKDQKRQRVTLEIEKEMLRQLEGFDNGALLDVLAEADEVDEYEYVKMVQFMKSRYEKLAAKSVQL